MSHIYRQWPGTRNYQWYLLMEKITHHLGGRAFVRDQSQCPTSRDKALWCRSSPSSLSITNLKMIWQSSGQFQSPWKIHGLNHPLNCTPPVFPHYIPEGSRNELLKLVFVPRFTHDFRQVSRSLLRRLQVGCSLKSICGASAWPFQFESNDSWHDVIW